jgi:AcrR family transcriptional regulator
LSRQTAPDRPRGRRGLDPNAILEAAFDMLSQEGEIGFSVRKLGPRIGVDPMTILHHFVSKQELLRRIADKALASIALPAATDDWRPNLRIVAKACRDLPAIRGCSICTFGSTQPDPPTMVSGALRPLGLNVAFLNVALRRMAVVARLMRHADAAAHVR